MKFVCFFNKKRTTLTDEKPFFVVQLNLHTGLPMVRPFFSQVSVGGGIPLASQLKMTGLLMVSTTVSSAGPSILGGTGERRNLKTYL